MQFVFVYVEAIISLFLVWGTTDAVIKIILALLRGQNYLYKRGVGQNIACLFRLLPHRPPF